MITTKCFECGKPSQEQHHVIPQSKGGTKIVPLCSPCHGKVHGIKRCDNLSSLIKEGIAKAKEKGIKIGNPNGWNGRQQLGGEARIKQRKINDNKVLSIIIELKENGLSYRKIAKHLNEANLTTTNKHFSGSSVFKIYKRNEK